MFDIILLTFVVGVFVSGFWCGKQFGTARKTWDAFTGYIGSFFK
jgi:hypothetical protein